MARPRKTKSYSRSYFQKRGRFFPEIKGLFYSLFIKLFLRPKSLLDVGCAEGKLIKWGLRLGIEAHGTDVSSAGFVGSEAVIRSRCQTGDILKLPFKKNQFKTLSCLALMEHIEARKTSRALKELLRVSEKYVLLQICVKDNPLEGKHYLLDPTHVNVRESVWWTKRFRELRLKVAFTVPKLGLFLIKKK